MKRIRIVWIAVLLACVLTGCRQNAPEAETGKSVEERPLQIGLSFDSFVIERWMRDRDVFVSTAEELGATVNVQNANGDIEEQISQIKYLIAKKVDVIAIVAIDGEALQEVVRQAENAGIRVICYDRLIQNADTDQVRGNRPLYLIRQRESRGTDGRVACQGTSGRRKYLCHLRIAKRQ